MNPFLKVQYSKARNVFPFYVTWVDQNSTIRDEQKIPTLKNVSPQTGRNLHIGGFKINQREGGNITLDVVVPQEVLGSFKMPQPGDIVMIREDRGTRGDVPVYLYSMYNDIEANKTGYNPVPQWGSQSGDYGHLRTHKDHNKQFSALESSNFITKFVRSITGYRFRNYYKSNLKEGKFVMRGDPVFDINPKINNLAEVIEDGLDIGYGDTITKNNQYEYPNPLNVPKTREEDPNYGYENIIYEPVPVEFNIDPYNFNSSLPEKTLRTYKSTLKNKNYTSYQPIMDKTYLDSAEFERELPAAEEYQVALRGNNKLLIQDQAGDGEQILITLKNQYDGQFTIVHNGDKGQVRIRDHLGQGVLMEADPEHPRVLSWTNAQQKTEQGFIPGTGAYTYVRNGDKFGDSDTSFGEKTGSTKNDVSNQEILMVSTGSIVGEIQNKLSSGMYGLSNVSAAGIFMRNNTDPASTNQTYAMYNTGSDLILESEQTYDAVMSRETKTVTASSSKREYFSTDGNDTITEKDEIDGGNTASKTITVATTSGHEVKYDLDAGNTETVISNKKAGKLENKITLDASQNLIEHYKENTKQSEIKQGETIDIKREVAGININIGDDTQPDPINIGNVNSDINILGTTVNVEGTTTQVGKVGFDVDIIGLTVNVEGNTTQVGKAGFDVDILGSTVNLEGDTTQVGNGGTNNIVGTTNFTPPPPESSSE